MSLRATNRRIVVLAAVFALLLGATLARAFWLQGVQGAKYAAMALAQHRETVTVPVPDMKPVAEAVIVAEPMPAPVTCGCGAGVLAPCGMTTPADGTVTLEVSLLFSATVTPPAVTLGGLPANPWTHVQNANTGKENLLVLGAANRLGQDEFLRLLYGARISLEVAILSTIGVMLIGVLLGAAAGYFRGTTDTFISRLTEITMAFPLLIFVISLAATVGPQLDSITLGVFPQGVLTLVMIFTLFGWFYPARIMRAQALSIREKEYVEAARMIGASDLRIIRSHILPHLVAPIIVLSSITVAQFILLEAGLSFLGIGIQQPTPSWGSLLSDGPAYYLSQPWLMVWPGLAILLTTLAFNLLGDGLRDAFDPRTSH